MNLDSGEFMRRVEVETRRSLSVSMPVLVGFFQLYNCTPLYRRSPKRRADETQRPPKSWRSKFKYLLSRCGWRASSRVATSRPEGHKIFRVVIRRSFAHERAREMMAQTSIRRGRDTTRHKTTCSTFQTSSSRSPVVFNVLSRL